MCPLDYSLPPVYSCEHRFELPFHHFTSSHGRVTVRMNLEASMQVGEMHFFSPSGCSFFGKRRLRTHELVRGQLRVIVSRYMHTFMQCVFLVVLCV